MEYKCEYCNKIYSSRQARWNHNKKYHVTEVSQSKPESKPESKPKSKHKVSIDESFPCRFCDKLFVHKQSRFRHEKTCNIEEDTNKKSTLEITKILEEMKKQNEQMKDMFQRALKIHPKTLQKINKQLINNGTINNNIINIVPLGNENLNQVLTDKEKLAILNKKYNSLNELINKVHILPDTRYNQFKNVYITNLQNDIAYEYNNNSKQFQAVDKNELLEKLIDKRMNDIETFALELDEKNNLPPELSSIIDKFIEQMWTDNSELKLKKIKQVKLLLYNNRDSIKDNLNKDFRILDL